MTKTPPNLLDLPCQPHLAKEDGGGRDRRYVMSDCHIAGFRYHEGPDIMQYLVPGERLDLIAEPGNPHDEWAVRVEHHKKRIGYLPRGHNQPISRLLQRGTGVECRITGVNPAAPPWEAIRIEVFMPGEDGMGISGG